MKQGAEAAPLALSVGDAADLPDIERQAERLLRDCLRAFHAFAELQRLAEELRVLSLSAGLAAERAGPRGGAVRALADDLRGLVDSFAERRRQVLSIKADSGRFDAQAWRALSFVRVLDGAGERARRGDGGTRGPAGALATVGRLRDGQAADVRAGVAGIAACVARLSSVAGQLGGAIREAGAIADRIATEAARTPAFAGEFKPVADGLAAWATRGRSALEDARRWLRGAASRGAQLEERARRLAATRSGETGDGPRPRRSP
jgi:ABC-type transporter Mla subunit MlaD